MTNATLCFFDLSGTYVHATQYYIPQGYLTGHGITGGTGGAPICAMTLKTLRLYAYAFTLAGAGAKVQLTVMKNGVATTLDYSITAVDAPFPIEINIAQTVTFNDDDRIMLKVVVVGTSGTFDVLGSIDFLLP